MRRSIGTFTSCFVVLSGIRSLVLGGSVALRDSSPVVVEFDVSQAAETSFPFKDTLFSVSIEFCYIGDYLGGLNAPNKLTLQLLQNIQDRTGNPPIIRLGGDTQDAARYCPTCNAPFTPTFNPGNTEAVDVAFNKDFFTILNNNVPSKQRYIFGLNFKKDNLSLTAAEVHAAQQYLDPARLISYELGNEVDDYDLYGSNARPGGWNVQTYVAETEKWLQTINTAENGKVPGWQIGTFAQQAQYQGNFSLREVIALGTLEAVPNIISLSEHTYFSSICNPQQAALVNLPYLMNHTNIVNYFSQWAPEIEATHAAGLPFVMGETGSVSCHGKVGVSNTLGAALWSIDYVLNAAVLGMDGVYFHQGTPFYYSMWQPVTYNNTPAVVYPTYYGMLFTAELIGHLTNARIYPLPSLSTSTFVVYAIFGGADLKKIVVINFDFYDPASMPSRPSTSVDVTGLFGGKCLRVKRLTGPMSASTSGVTMMGESFDEGLEGGEREEEWSSGVVVVQATEAVIIENEG